MLLLLVACEPALTNLPNTAVTEPAITAETCTESRLGLLPDDVSDLGFTPEEAVADVVGVFESTLVYRDLLSTSLSIDVALIFAEDVQRMSPGATAQSGAPVVLECEGRALVLEFEVTLSTGDGAFDEQFIVIVETTEPMAGLFVGPYLPASELVGAYGFDGLAEISVAAQLHPGHQTNGELIEIREDGSECGIGSWNAPLMTSCP